MGMNESVKQIVNRLTIDGQVAINILSFWLLQILVKNIIGLDFFKDKLLGDNKGPLVAPGHGHAYALLALLHMFSSCLSVHRLIEPPHARARRSEEHTSEPQSLMPISYAASCLKKKQ